VRVLYLAAGLIQLGCQRLECAVTGQIGGYNSNFCTIMLILANRALAACKAADYIHPAEREIVQ
jgi:hypothetical protein